MHHDESSVTGQLSQLVSLLCNPLQCLLNLSLFFIIKDKISRHLPTYQTYRGPLRSWGKVPHPWKHTIHQVLSCSNPNHHTYSSSLHTEQITHSSWPIDDFITRIQYFLSSLSILYSHCPKVLKRKKTKCIKF